MVNFRQLSSLSEDDATIVAASPIQPSTPLPPSVAASQEEFLVAVSEAASAAATSVVLKGLVGYAALTVTSMATRRMGIGFLPGVLLVSGVSFIAASALK